MSLKQTALLGLIFVTLLSLTIWDHVREETASMEAYAERDLLGVPFDEIDSLTLDNRHGHFELERRDGEWWLLDPIETRADPIVNIAVNNLSNAKRHSAVEGVPDGDLGDFGLAEPAIRARIGTVDGGEIALLIGADAPALNRHFATVSGSGDVFTVSGHVVGNLDKSLDLLRDRRLFANLDLPRRVTSLTVSSESGAVRIAPDEENALRIEGHPEHLADVGLYLELLRGMDGLRARSFAGEIAEQRVGLEPPLLTLRLFGGEEEIAGLDIGIPTSRMAEEFYARAHGSDEVVTLSSADISLIPRRWPDWIDRDLLHLSPEEIVSFSLSLPNSSSETVLSFAKSDGGDWQSTIDPDQIVNQETVAALLSLFDRLQSEGVVSADPEAMEMFGLDSPWIIFTWSGPTDEEGNRTVERIDHGNSAGTTQAHFRRNSQPIVHIAPALLRDVLELRSDLFDRRMVTVNLGLTGEIVCGVGGEETTIRLVEDHWERVDLQGQTRRVSFTAVETALSTMPALEYDSVLSGRPADLIRSRLLEQPPWQVTLLDQEGRSLIDLRASEIPSLGNRDEPIFVLLNGQRVCEIRNREALISLDSAFRALITR